LKSALILGFRVAQVDPYVAEAVAEAAERAEI